MNKTLVKRTILVLLAFCCLYLLSGCSFSDLAGVSQDPDYQTWNRLSENGKLDQDGQYTADAVHVTFASNGFLETHYYTDAEKQNEITEGGIYLLPGDFVYVTAEVKKSSRDIYLFDHLDLIEYSKENERGDKLNWPIGEDGLSFMIPYDYKGTEVSVEPAGRFGDRQLVLIEHYSSGEIAADGQWLLNNEPVAGDTIPVNALDSYTVEYQYDADRYFLVSSQPKPWADAIGRVIFNKSDAKTGVEEYHVFLSPYAIAEIKVSNGKILSAEDKSGRIITQQKNEHQLVASRLRANGRLKITTDTKNINDLVCDSPKIKYTINGPDTIRDETTQKENYVYEIVFGEMNQFLFIPSEYAVEHGQLKFSCDGKEITEGVTLSTGTVISYEATETEEGYWLPDNGGSITVDGSNTETQLREIRFYPYKQVSVILEQPEVGGKIIYKANGETLSGKAVDLYCGTKITAEFEPDNGWESALGKEVNYTVSTVNNQPVSFENEDGIIPANQIFRETMEHKPKLKVEISRNIGNSKIIIEANGHPRKEYSHNGNGDRNTIVNEIKIGTDQDIVLTFATLDLQNGNNALRITVNKKASNGGYKEIRYVTKANKPEYIKLIKDKWYNSVSILVEAAKVEEPVKLITSDDAEIIARFSDVTLDDPYANPNLTSGMIVTADRRLDVTIKPNQGFFMTGGYIQSNGNYQRNMSYEEYKRLIPEVLKTQIKKEEITLTLVKDGVHGNAVYLIDNEEKEGQVTVPEDKEIVIKYTLTDDAYEIKGDRTVFDQAWNLIDTAGNNKYEVRIKVTREMDGTTIEPEKFIRVEKKGGGQE